jgi:hypothetical protein
MTFALVLMLLSVTSGKLIVTKWPNQNCAGAPMAVAEFFPNECIYDVAFGGYSLSGDCVYYGVQVAVSVNVRLCTNSSTCDGNCSMLSGNAGTCANQTTFSSMITCWSTVTTPSLLCALLTFFYFAFLS